MGLELLHCPCPKGVAGGDCDLQGGGHADGDRAVWRQWGNRALAPNLDAVLTQPIGDLCEIRGLSDPVDATKDNHVRLALFLSLANVEENVDLKRKVPRKLIDCFGPTERLV